MADFKVACEFLRVVSELIALGCTLTLAIAIRAAPSKFVINFIAAFQSLR